MKKPVLRFLLVGSLLVVTGSLVLGLPHAIAASPINNAGANFNIAWIYDSPGDNFTNHQVTGRKVWETSIHNSPDETKAPITGLSLTLDSGLLFTAIGPNNLITNRPPTYEWSFGDIPDGGDAFATVGPIQTGRPVSSKLTFTPGFDAARSADKTKFLASGVQTLTLTVTPREEMPKVTIHVNLNTKDSDIVDAIITSPSSESYIHLSPDGQNLDVDIPNPEAGVTYTTIVTIQVTPKTSDITFLPGVIVESGKDVASGSVSGSLVSRTFSELEDEPGLWTWRAQGSYLWQWRETLSYRVSFDSISLGTGGPGLKGEQGALIFNQQFDSGLLILLVVISPFLYFAGRRFRKEGRSLNLTWVVLPVGFLIFGWYTGSNGIYRTIFAPYLPPEPILWWVGYSITFVLPFAAFSYALVKRVKLEFKWSALSMIGMILVIYFLTLAIYQFFNPNITKFHLFIGSFDQTFYPIAYGLLTLCDLKKMPRGFWLILLAHNVVNLTVVASAISSLVFNHLLFGYEQAVTASPSNFLPSYFGVNNRAELFSLPPAIFMYDLTIAVREVLCAIVVIQAMNFYYLWKGFDKKSRFTLTRRTRMMSFVLSIMLLLLGWGGLALVTGQTDHALWDPNNRPPPGIPLTFPYRVPGIIIGAIGVVIFAANIFYFFRKRGKGKQE